MKTQSNPSPAAPETSSGQHTSYWTASVLPVRTLPLDQDLHADVVVIGAGISGISVAYNLVRAGRKVVVLEDGDAGSGETGRTTAHLVNALDDFYTDIEKYHGSDGARIAAESHTAAIDFIERIVGEENIACDFERLDGYLFLHPSDQQQTLDEEYKATRKAGIATALLTRTPGLPAEIPCLHYPQQAQFHPLKYLNALIAAFQREGGVLYTQTHADQIREHEVIANGFRVRANSIVVATNTPVNDTLTMHTKQYAYRSYVIGVEVPKGSVQHALWWDTGDHDSRWITMPYKYIRLQPLNETTDLLICGGEDHKTGQADEEDIPETARYEALISWVKANFPQAGEVVYRWSGQVMEPLDAMGYIGRNPGDEDIYIVTGDSGNGMTHGTIAGILITDLITGRENEWTKLYDPSRITLRVTGDYLKEGADLAKQYTDLLSKGADITPSALPNGHGAVISNNGKKEAIYRDETGRLYTHSAICPHLGCVVQWNQDEKSFDCPCHGSRFSCSGEVINGPANTNLPQA